MKYDLIIIGAGPAGAAAGIYSARQKLKTLIISKDVGGQLSKKAVDIENYPGFRKISGIELANELASQLAGNNVEIKFDEVLRIEKLDKIFKVKAESGEYESLAVIATSGAEPKKLNIEGEDKFSGKGVSYCALCDGPVFRDKSVAVIGGGNSGFESALFLSNYVKEIFILEFGADPKADQKSQDLVMKSGKAKIITNARVRKIEGDNFVKNIVFENLETGKEEKLNVSGVFVEIGYSPEANYLDGLVDFTKRGEIIANLENLETKTPGLFAAGDCTQEKYKQIIISAGQGAKAALSAYEYIKKSQK